MTLIDAFRSLLAFPCTPDLHRFPDATRCRCGAFVLVRDSDTPRRAAIRGKGLRTMLRTRLR